MKFIESPLHTKRDEYYFNLGHAMGHREVADMVLEFAKDLWDRKGGPEAEALRKFAKGIKQNARTIIPKTHWCTTSGEK